MDRQLRRSYLPQHKQSPGHRKVHEFVIGQLQGQSTARHHTFRTHTYIFVKNYSKRNAVQIFTMTVRGF